MQDCGTVILEGEPLSISDLYSREHARIIAYLQSHGYRCNQDEAEELVQIIFLKITAYQHKQDHPLVFPSIGQLRHWLNDIAIHAYIDSKRAKSITPLSLDMLCEPKDDDNAFELVDETDIAEQVAARLDVQLMLLHISEKEREALYLFHIKGLSYREIEARLHISMNVLNHRLMNGRKAFLKHYLFGRMYIHQNNIKAKRKDQRA